MGLEVGSRLGHYDVTALIGEGGMGQVYRVSVDLLRIPGAGHGPTFPGAENPPDYIRAMVGWFDCYVPSHWEESREGRDEP